MWVEMSKTVSFVARDELAEWLESRADAEMKSISSVCQDIVAAEYRRQRGSETAKPDQTQDDTPEPLESETQFDFASKQEADAVRTEFKEYVSEENDDKRMKFVFFEEGTPGEVVEELERRSE
jgi:hypothetical protein